MITIMTMAIIMAVTIMMITIMMITIIAITIFKNRKWNMNVTNQVATGMGTIVTNITTIEKNVKMTTFLVIMAAIGIGITNRTNASGTARIQITRKQQLSSILTLRIRFLKPIVKNSKRLTFNLPMQRFLSTTGLLTTLLVKHSVLNSKNVNS